MPKDFEFFLPALSAVHGYIMQIRNQGKECAMKMELGDESHLFFAPLFLRMNVVVGYETDFRENWDCVLDLRDVDRPYRLAKATKLHLAAAWGVIFGGSPKRIPTLAYFGARIKREEIDILIDCGVTQAKQLEVYFRKNYPEITMKIDRVNGLRPATMFDKLCGTKMYIGWRSGATYLAATMGKRLVELYPDEFPSWWLSKPEEYCKTICGEDFSPELIWAYAEELWQSIYNMKCREEISTVRPASIVDSVAVR